MRQFSLCVLITVLGACSSPGVEPQDCQDGRCDTIPPGEYQVAAGDYRFCLAPGYASMKERETIADAFVDMPLPHLESLRLLAHFSDMAYWEPADIGVELIRLGFGQLEEEPIADYATSAHRERSIEVFSASTSEAGQQVQGSTQMFWAQHRSEPWVVISFRGTQFSEAADLWTDLNFPLASFKGEDSQWGTVHGGFLDAYHAISDQLEARLQATAPGTKIWITGHSLGGALASLAAADLLAKIEDGRKLSLAGMVSFGSPRVGDSRFFAKAEAAALAHGVALHRVSNISNDSTGFDPIPLSPFHSTFGDEFKHIGAPIGVFEDGTMSYALETTRWLPPFGLFDKAVALFKQELLAYLSESFPHRLVHYHDRLATAASKSTHHSALRRCGPR